MKLLAKRSTINYISTAFSKNEERKDQVLEIFNITKKNLSQNDRILLKTFLKSHYKIQSGHLPLNKHDHQLNNCTQ